MSLKSKTILMNAQALTEDTASSSVKFENAITNVIGYLKVTGGAVDTTIDVDIEISPDNSNWYTLKSFTQIVGATGSEVIQFNNTTEHFMKYARANVDLGVTLQGNITVELHYDII